MSSVAELQAELKAVRSQLKQLNGNDTSKLEEQLQTKAVPYATTGPVGEDSRGFSLSRAMALQAGLIDADKCKPEVEASNLFRKSLVAANQMPRNTGPRSCLVPLGSDYLPPDVVNSTEYRTCKAMWGAGASGADPDEMTWLAKSIMKKAQPGSVSYKTAMSYLTDSIGGTLVAAPAQGDLIELIRPRECLMAAGATTVPLPPQGAISFPRQTTPTTMYWVGENTEMTESNPQTGQINMQAKKAGVLVTVPNELLLYASVAADALIRTDTAKTIALGIDYAGLYGTGAAAQPQGLSSYNGTNQVIFYESASPAPKGIATNGNTLRPEDAYRIIGLIEDRNFDFSGWIARPTMANNIQGYRADAVAAADAAGTFVQSLTRAITDRMPGENWAGHKMTKSAVIKNTLSKGNASNLTEIWGGQWEHLMIGMFGSVEFAASNQAGDTFKKDQTQIRALVHCDIAPRYEGAFAVYRYLVNSTN